MKTKIATILFILIVLSSGVLAEEESNVIPAEPAVSSDESSPNTDGGTTETNAVDVPIVISAASEATISEGSAEVSAEVGIDTDGDGITVVIANSGTTEDGYYSSAMAGTTDSAYDAYVSTSAEAEGKEMVLESIAHAEGNKIKAGGSSKLEGTGGATVEIITDTISSGLYRVTVISRVIGTGIGETYAWAWAEFERLENSGGNSNNNAVSTSNNMIGGYIFGHSDAERYWHFKKQAISNCYDGVNESEFNTCARAVYNMEVLLDRNGETQSTFEYKYGLNKTIEMRSILINLSIQ